MQFIQPKKLSSFAGTNSGLVVMAYGAEGTGKTHFAGTGPAPLFISVGKSTDGGLRSAAGNQNGMAFQAFHLDNPSDPEHSLLAIIRSLDAMITQGALTPANANPIVLDHLFGASELVLGQYKNYGLNVELTQAEVTNRMKRLQSFDNTNAIDAIMSETILPAITRWGTLGFNVVILNHESALSDKKLAKLGESNYALFHPWGTHKMSEWFKKNIPVIIHSKRELVNTGQITQDGKPIIQTKFALTLGADMQFFTKSNVLGSFNLPQEIPNDFNTFLKVINDAAQGSLGGAPAPTNIPTAAPVVNQAPQEPVTPAVPVQQPQVEVQPPAQPGFNLGGAAEVVGSPTPPVQAPQAPQEPQVTQQVEEQVNPPVQGLDLGFGNQGAPVITPQVPQEPVQPEVVTPPAPPTPPVGLTPNSPVVPPQPGNQQVDPGTKELVNNAFATLFPQGGN